MSTRRAKLSVIEGAAIVLGIVIGMGIFRSPAQVASAAGGPELALALWALGGLVSLMGAFTYAELACAYPDRGGEYHFLRMAYGRLVAFLFGWARLTIIQTGAIAAAGFVFGEYLSLYLPLGEHGAAIYAAIAVLVVGAINLAGLKPSVGAQSVFAAGLVGCLVALAAAGIAAPAAPPEPAAAEAPTLAALGFGMIFVLLAYGGWNEAAYLGGEVERPQRDLALILVSGVGAVTILYLLVNWAYLNALGTSAVAQAETVGAELARAALGPAGAALVAAFALAAGLSTMNGTLFTGARSAFALGRDFPLFAPLARWDAAAAGAPRAAIMAPTASAP